MIRRRGFVMEENRATRRIDVNGIVQGVGFRPFVYQLANRRKLKGDVANTSSGVVIRLEGSEAEIESFLTDLEKNPPPLAQITNIEVADETWKGFLDFSITESRRNETRSTLISPDMCVCGDCLRELFDPCDRRYRYPFVNCTNCGPRYTIIEDIPYDRPKTSMKRFKMCSRCQEEYDDPGDRRFHAQPNACPECGPQVALFDSRGVKIPCDDPIRETARLILSGHIVAVKGIGGFHLAADARNDEALRTLRRRKHREEKPLAIMVPNIDGIRAFARLTDEDEALLKNPRRPIVILEKKTSNDISVHVAPGNGNFGVMLPYTPLHFLLLAETDAPLVMTSGNVSEEPICIDNDEAFERLSGIADFFLAHDRDICLRSDDSIARRMAWETRMIRRSRGYVPVPIFLGRKYPQVLACGAELKNTVCLAKEDKAFLSQHIGDLENQSALDFFKTTIGHMKRILDIEPELIACDMHPDYLSTRYALEQSELPVIQVQHHHAHIVSCLAENRIDGPVIGLAFDGTGCGIDGAVWGGEVLIADRTKFGRAARLDYVAMPGAAAAIKEPYRMALSYLFHAFGNDFENLDIPFIQKTDKSKARIFVQMIERKLNSPATSSMGRLFDGVAAMVGIRDKVAFEGQAAMELETAAEWPTEEHYDFEWTSGDCRIVSVASIVRGVATDLENGLGTARISGKFHRTLVRMFSLLCEEIRADSGIDTVALSGGSFQNNLLLTGLVEALGKSGFHVLTQRTAPCNDGGIALGQAVSAAARVA